MKMDETRASIDNVSIPKLNDCNDINNNNNSNNNDDENDNDNKEFEKENGIETRLNNDRWDVSDLNSHQKRLLDEYVFLKDGLYNLTNTSGIVQGLIIGVIFSLMGTFNSQFWDSLQQNMIDGECENLFRGTFKFISNTTYAAIVSSLFNLLIIFAASGVSDPLKKHKLIGFLSDKISSENSTYTISLYCKQDQV